MPVKCPIAGKFNFTQRGEVQFETRVLGGVTKTPWDDIQCRENISDLSVCDKDQKEIWIDAHYCITVDAYGRHMDIYSKWLELTEWQLYGSTVISEWMTPKMLLWLIEMLYKVTTDIKMIKREGLEGQPLTSPSAHSWSRLQAEVHWVLEGESQVIPDHLWWAGPILQVQVLGKHTGSNCNERS